MKNLSEAEKRFPFLTYETFAFWAYVLGVAMTAFGPIIHYISWFLVLVSLIYGKIRYNAPLSIKLQPESKKVVFFLILFLLWSMFANVIVVESFYLWGKGSSIPLEFLTGLYLAMRLIDTSDKRKLFGLAIVAVNLIFCFDVMFRPHFYLLGWNTSLDNGNAVSLYSLLMMPFFFSYAFWFFEKKVVLKYVLPVASLMLIVFSFSSGGWLTAFFQIIIFIGYSMAIKKISIKSFFMFLVILLILLTVSPHFLGKEYLASFKREFDQITAMNDSQTMTNHRIYTWKAGVILARDHMLVGNGWATFEGNFVKNFEYLKKKVNYDGTVYFVQPHNMYISILYAGGLPAFFLFMAAFIMSTIKTWSGLKRGSLNTSIPWDLICFILMVSMAVYGTNGDVFEARRDLGVIFWASWGVLLMLPENCAQKTEGDQNENTALC